MGSGAEYYEPVIIYRLGGGGAGARESLDF